jgi:GntR family transcriptional regulator, carbon starvation induced regulator
MVHDDDKSRKATRSLTRDLTDDLRGRILRGDLAPGARLSIKDLSDELNVSLSPLREAMTRLGAESLLRADEQRGFSVTPVSEGDLAEVIRLRIVMERMALAEAVKRGTLDWETEVMSALYRMSRIDRTRPGPDAKLEWEHAHNAFHTALVSACGMPMLLQFIATLHGLTDRYRRIFLSTNPPDKATAREHTQIAEAACARRSDEATDLLARHIERTGTAIRKRLAAK